MTPGALYLASSIVLFLLGLFGVAKAAEPLRRIMALNLMAGAVFLFLVGSAYRGGEVAPDPVPHAMVLTGIVVSFSATALAIALVRRLDREP